jgi:hypothetical protein
MSKDATPAAQNGFEKPSPIGRDQDLGAMSGNSTVVGAYSAHAAAENAIQQLRKSGYDIRKLSIVVEDYRIEERVVGFYTTDDRIKCWGKAGLLWGGTLGLLFGTALFVFPEIGPGPLAGPLPLWISGAFWGAVTNGGLSAIIAGVYSVSLPKDSVLKYELEMAADSQCMLVASGADEAAAARELLWVARAGGSDEHSSASFANPAY